VAAEKASLLHDFIQLNRTEILDRTRSRVAARSAPQPTADEIESGIPLFLDELAEMLRDRLHSSAVIDRSATRHGSNRFVTGFTVTQVVHDYGDVCQVVTELAIESGAPVSTEDFRVLNRCLDEAIAGAVTEHTRASQKALAELATERLGILAHELRNELNTAMLAHEILKDGKVGIGGSTSGVLNRSLLAMEVLINRSLAEVRLDARLHDPQLIDVRLFLGEIELAAVIAAKSAGISLSTQLGDQGVQVLADRQLLSSAVTNMVHNALKFSPKGGHVSLNTNASKGQVRIEVQDTCNGLPEAIVAGLFLPFHQGQPDSSVGLGLGLSISARAVESMHGTLEARNLDGGCIFTIELPRVTVGSS
jgi:signal transduction histidine kinase